MSSKTYDQLKFVAQVLLPALGTLYFTLAGIWNLPAPEQVVGTIVAVDTFLGVLLHISTVNYKKNDTRFGGSLVLKEVGDKKLYSLELNDDPEQIQNKNEITFKVEKKK